MSKNYLWMPLGKWYICSFCGAMGHSVIVMFIGNEDKQVQYCRGCWEQHRLMN